MDGNAFPLAGEGPGETSVELHILSFQSPGSAGKGATSALAYWFSISFLLDLSF